MALQLRIARMTGPDLRERRHDAEATQDEIGARLGVTRQRIAAIEALAAPSRGAVRRFLGAIADVEAER